MELAKFIAASSILGDLVAETTGHVVRIQPREKTILLCFTDTEGRAVDPTDVKNGRSLLNNSWALDRKSFKKLCDAINDLKRPIEEQWVLSDCLDYVDNGYGEDYEDDYEDEDDFEDDDYEDEDDDYEDEDDFEDDDYEDEDDDYEDEDGAIPSCFWFNRPDSEEFDDDDEEEDDDYF